jgi:hypothetical protein
MFPIECYVFRVILKTNSDYFLKRHWLIGLLMETQCVSCEVETEFLHIYKKFMPQIVNTYGLMLFKETNAVYCENHTKHTNTLCGQNAELFLC